MTDKNNETHKPYDVSDSSVERPGMCKHRVWGWHDGGTDFRCSAQGENFSCFDSYGDFQSGKGCIHNAHHQPKSATCDGYAK